MIFIKDSKILFVFEFGMDWTRSNAIKFCSD